MASTNDKMSLDFIQGAGLNTDLINTALDEVEVSATDKKQEEAQARTQFKQNQEARADTNTQSEILAATLINSTASQQNFIKAKAEFEKQEIDETANNEFINKNIEQRDVLESLQARNLEQINEINLRTDGYKKDEQGNIVPMSTGEKIISFITKDLAYSPAARKQMLLNENANLDAEILNTQQQMSNAIINQTAGIGNSEKFRNTKKLVIDAEAFSNLDSISLSEKESLYNLAKESYGLEKDQLNEIVSIAGMYDESEKTNQIIQLASLKLESDRMKLAYGEQNSEKELENSLHTYIKNAYEVAGFDTADKTVQAEMKIYAKGVAQNRWDVIGNVIRENPATLSVLNAMKDGEMLVDSVVAGDINLARTVSQSDDVEAKTVADLKIRIYEGAMKSYSSADPDSSESKMVERLIAAKGVNIGDDNYAETKQAVLSELANDAAQNEMQRMLANSIDYDRSSNQLTPIAHAATSAYFLEKSKRDPGSNLSQKTIIASSTLSKKLDSDLETFSSDPKRFLQDFINDKSNGLTYESTDSDINEYAKGMAITFEALKDANGLQSQNNVMYKNTDNWTLSTDAKFGSFNLKGRDLTDAATWTFLLKSIVKNPGSKARFQSEVLNDQRKAYYSGLNKQGD